MVDVITMIVRKSLAYVDEPQPPPPHRLPLEIAALKQNSVYN